jgi:hypothetical protein
MQHRIVGIELARGPSIQIEVSLGVAFKTLAGVQKLEGRVNVYKILMNKFTHLILN